MFDKRVQNILTETSRTDQSRNRFRFERAGEGGDSSDQVAHAQRYCGDGSSELDKPCTEVNVLCCLWLIEIASADVKKKSIGCILSCVQLQA